MGKLDTTSLEKYYRASEEYPEIRVQCDNTHYAELLLKDYAGSTSELTAITTYIQNHIVGNPKYELAVEAFRGVAIVEMHHLDMLGTAIVELGGFPMYGSYKHGEECFWNGSIVPPTYNMMQMLEEAIDSEYAAIDQYYAHIDAIHDSYVRNLLERIIKDEECHIKLFKKLLRYYS